MTSFHPAEHRSLIGSEQRSAKHAIRRRPTEWTEKIKVSVRRRRRPGAGPLPDCDTVRPFADRFGLSVDQASVARRTVQLRGATNMGPGLGSGNGTTVMAGKGIRGDQGIYWSTLEDEGWRAQRPMTDVGTSPDLLVRAG